MIRSACKDTPSHIMEGCWREVSHEHQLGGCGGPDERWLWHGLGW